MGCLRRIFRYKIFVDALFHPEVMSVFNLLIDNWYFTLQVNTLNNAVYFNAAFNQKILK